VYSCTGAPFPADIRQITHWLLNSSVKEAIHNIRELQVRRGLALSDIVAGVSEVIRVMEFPARMSAFLFEQLATLEYVLRCGIGRELGYSVDQCARSVGGLHRSYSLGANCLSFVALFVVLVVVPP
jgi:hypothetical protein